MVCSMACGVHCLNKSDGVGRRHEMGAKQFIVGLLGKGEKQGTRGCSDAGFAGGPIGRDGIGLPGQKRDRRPWPPRGEVSDR